MPLSEETRLVRFWSNVSKGFEDDSCYEWQGTLNSTGYGISSTDNYPVREAAHRTAWKLLVGPIPEGMLVLHKCDNRRCVRTLHLFLGTYTDNMRDMIQKGRQNNYRNPTNYRRGERVPLAKLTTDQVLEIRFRYPAESLSHLARQYKVTPTTIQNIVNNKTWKHVCR